MSFAFDVKTERHISAKISNAFRQRHKCNVLHDQKCINAPNELTILYYMITITFSLINYLNDPEFFLALWVRY